MSLDPAHLSRGTLAAMSAGGESVGRAEEAMRAAGTNPRDLLTGGGHADPFQHYPDGDVYDYTTCSQFYFHGHRLGEHGHIHLFLRPGGMPPGLKPVVAGDGDDAPCHLVAVGLNSHGFATELFTTNRWVTGEAWYDADAVTAMLPHFQVAENAKGRLVGPWLTGLVRLFLPLVAVLAERRDKAVADWAAAHPDVQPLEDEGLEVTSRAAIDVPSWRKALAQELGRQ